MKNKTKNIFKRWVKVILIGAVVLGLLFGVMFSASVLAEKKYYKHHNMCQEYLMDQTYDWTSAGDSWYLNECDFENEYSLYGLLRNHMLNSADRAGSVGSIFGIFLGLLALSYFARWLITGEWKEKK